MGGGHLLMSPVSWGEIGLALALDCANWLVLSLLTFSVLALWKSNTSRNLLDLLVPGLCVYGFFCLLPSTAIPRSSGYYHLLILFSLFMVWRAFGVYKTQFNAQKRPRPFQAGVISLYLILANLFFFLPFVFPLSPQGAPLNWFFWNHAAIGIILFFFIFLFSPLDRLPLPTRLALPKFFLDLSIGFFILLVGFWFYFLFHAAVKERPGSFRLKGAIYSLEEAQAWGFGRLERLIEEHWRYPAPPNIKPKPYPKRGEELIVFGIQECEKFYQELTAPLEDGTLPAKFFVKALIEFQEQSAPHLSGRPGLGNFQLVEEDLLAAIQGSADILVNRDCFHPFSGRWYGLWDERRVDHEWRIPLEINPPRPVDKTGFDIQILQYAWVGDGFGWNFLVNPHGKTDTMILMGMVYHTDDLNTEQVSNYDPHIGIDAGPGRIIWITPGHIFFEEIFDKTDLGSNLYTITGFTFFTDKKTNLISDKGFQTIYTRDPEQRPEWISFPTAIEIQ